MKAIGKEVVVEIEVSVNGVETETGDEINGVPGTKIGLCETGVHGMKLTWT